MKKDFKYLIDNGYIYSLTFDCKRLGQEYITVLSDDKNDIMSFINQHNLPQEGLLYIKEHWLTHELYDKIESKLSQYALLPMIFKSNMKKEEIEILTTYEIVKIVSTYACEELDNALRFGYLLTGMKTLYENNQLPNLINELMNNIKYIISDSDKIIFYKVDDFKLLIDGQRLLQEDTRIARTTFECYVSAFVRLVYGEGVKEYGSNKTNTD